MVSGCTSFFMGKLKLKKFSFLSIEFLHYKHSIFEIYSPEKFLIKSLLRVSLLCFKPSIKDIKHSCTSFC